MKNEDVMNILFSFIIIGIIVIINSIKNALWGLYWILFSLYLILFFMMGIKETNSSPTKLMMNIGPVVIISILITWLIQIFKNNQELLFSDASNRLLNLEEKIPDTFYELYAGALFILLIMVLVVLKNTRDNIVEKEFTLDNTAVTATLMQLSVYGLGLVDFMLILSMHIMITYYVTDG